MKDLIINFSLLMTKLKASITGVISIILAFVLPIKPLILIVGAAIALDTFTGIWRARKTKEKITSRRLSKIVSKMVLYQAALILFFAMEKYILDDFVMMFTSIPLFLTKMVAATLAFIELKSINENYEIISGVSLWDKFKELLSRGKELKKDLSDVIDDDDKKEE